MCDQNSEGNRKKKVSGPADRLQQGDASWGRPYLGQCLKKHKGLEKGMTENLFFKKLRVAKTRQTVPDIEVGKKKKSPCGDVKKMAC